MTTNKFSHFNRSIQFWRDPEAPDALVHGLWVKHYAAQEASIKLRERSNAVRRKTGTKFRFSAQSAMLQEEDDEEIDYATAPFSAYGDGRRRQSKFFAGAGIAGWTAPQWKTGQAAKDAGTTHHLVGAANIFNFTLDLLALYPRKDLKENLDDWMEFVKEELPRAMQAEKEKKRNQSVMSQGSGGECDSDIDPDEVAAAAVRHLSGNSNAKDNEMAVSRDRFMQLLMAHMVDLNPSKLVKGYWDDCCEHSYDWGIWSLMVGAVLTMLTALFTLATGLAVAFENPSAALTVFVLAVVISVAGFYILDADPWLTCCSQEDKLIEELGENKPVDAMLPKRAKSRNPFGKRGGRPVDSSGSTPKAASRLSTQSVVARKQTLEVRDERNKATLKLRKVLDEVDPQFQATSKELQSIKQVERLWILNHAFTEQLHGKGPLRKEGSLHKMSVDGMTGGEGGRMTVLEQEKMDAAQAADDPQLKLHTILTNLLGRKKASLQWRQRWKEVLKPSLENLRSKDLTSGEHITSYDALEYKHPKTKENALHVAMQATAVMVHDNEAFAAEQAPLFLAYLLSEETLDTKTDEELRWRRQAILYSKDANGLTPMEAGVKHHAPMEAVKTCLECMGTVDTGMLKDAVGLALTTGASLDVITFLGEEVTKAKARDANAVAEDAESADVRQTRSSVLDRDSVAFPSTVPSAAAYTVITERQRPTLTLKLADIDKGGGGRPRSPGLSLRDRRKARSVSDLPLDQISAVPSRLKAGTSTRRRLDDELQEVLELEEETGLPDGRGLYVGSGGGGYRSREKRHTHFQIAPDASVHHTPPDLAKVDSGHDTSTSSDASKQGRRASRANDGRDGASKQHLKGNGADGGGSSNVNFSGDGERRESEARSFDSPFFGAPAKLNTAESRFPTPFEQNQVYHEVHSAGGSSSGGRGGGSDEGSDSEDSAELSFPVATKGTPRKESSAIAFPEAPKGARRTLLSALHGARNVTAMGASKRKQPQQPRRMSTRTELEL